MAGIVIALLEVVFDHALVLVVILLFLLAVVRARHMARRCRNTASVIRPIRWVYLLRGGRLDQCMRQGLIMLGVVHSANVCK